mmetsp:Transcript_19981/g.65075  ORF Transcript_19981/g.65075 Transcript_19981/m.65075 type:complete len:390 (+) Transcript_19981:1500-2669(+)
MVSAWSSFGSTPMPQHQLQSRRGSTGLYVRWAVTLEMPMSESSTLAECSLSLLTSLSRIKMGSPRITRYPTLKPPSASTSISLAAKADGPHPLPRLNICTCSSTAVRSSESCATSSTSVVSFFISPMCPARRSISLASTFASRPSICRSSSRPSVRSSKISSPPSSTLRPVSSSTRACIAFDSSLYAGVVIWISNCKNCISSWILSCRLAKSAVSFFMLANRWSQPLSLYPATRASASVRRSRRRAVDGPTRSSTAGSACKSARATRPHSPESCWQLRRAANVCSAVAHTSSATPKMLPTTGSLSPTSRMPLTNSRPKSAASWAKASPGGSSTLSPSNSSTGGAASPAAAASSRSALRSSNHACARVAIDATVVTAASDFSSSPPPNEA